MTTRRMTMFKLILSAGVVATSLLNASSSFAADNVNVFAAASLKNALDAVSASWKADTKKETTITYAASNALAKQIELGAPADVFVSADLTWMKYLTDKNLIVKGSDIQLLGNQIVLVAPKDSKIDIKIEPNFKLADALGAGKLAMGNVESVPAGKYGKAALEKLGVWASVESKVAQADNVRAALKLVDVGEAALGVVYATDAKADATVKVVGTFPADSHAPIIYPAGIVAASKNADAAEFVKYLQSDKAKVIFESQGFIVLKQ
jgi:molybdate transport system substrate-binding protein